MLRDGEAVASLVADTNDRSMRTAWLVELLADARPAPFTNAVHRFDSLDAACEWLGAERPTGSEVRGMLRND